MAANTQVAVLNPSPLTSHTLSQSLPPQPPRHPRQTPPIRPQTRASRHPPSTHHHRTSSHARTPIIATTTTAARSQPSADHTRTRPLLLLAAPLTPLHPSRSSRFRSRVTRSIRNSPTSPTRPDYKLACGPQSCPPCRRDHPPQKPSAGPPIAAHHDPKKRKIRAPSSLST